MAHFKFRLGLQYLSQKYQGPGPRRDGVTVTAAVTVAATIVPVDRDSEGGPAVVLESKAC